MSYVERLQYYYPEVFSKEESIQILAQYKDHLSGLEYEAVLDSLCNHALEDIYLNEKDIVAAITLMRGEVTLDEIVEIAKAS